MLLYELHVEHQAHVKSLTLITSTPKKAFSRNYIPQRALTLVPITPTIYLTKGNDSAPQHTSDFGPVGVSSINGKPIHAYGVPKIQKTFVDVVMGPVTKKPTFEFYAPYWFVSKTANKARSNMIVTTCTKSVPMTKDKIKFHLFTNSRAIVEGEELLVYESPPLSVAPTLPAQPKAEKTVPSPPAKRPAPVKGAQPAAKRAAH